MSDSIVELCNCIGHVCVILQCSHGTGAMYLALSRGLDSKLLVQCYLILLLLLIAHLALFVHYADV